MARKFSVNIVSDSGVNTSVNADGSQNVFLVPPPTGRVCLNLSGAGTFEILSASPSTGKKVVLLFAISNGNNSITVNIGDSVFLGPVDLVPQVGFHLGLDGFTPVIETVPTKALTVTTETSAEVSVLAVYLT